MTGPNMKKPLEPITQPITFDFGIAAMTECQAGPAGVLKAGAL